MSYLTSWQNLVCNKMPQDRRRHEPAMPELVAELLACGSGGVYLDCTLGDGGHTEVLLERSSPDGVVFGVDTDIEAVESAKERLEKFSNRFRPLNDRFENIGKLGGEIALLKPEGADGILFDLGVSTLQLDAPGRGFSFLRDGPLDMRMDRGSENSAESIVNRFSRVELSRLFQKYGEEKRAWQLAGRIVRERQKGPITTTGQLAKLAGPHVRGRIHPATRMFQALRIEVNGELIKLEESLQKAVEMLSPGGRIAVISYHSLEDRIVKRTFRALEKGCVCPPSIPVCVCGVKPALKVLTGKAIRPGDEEIRDNPRVRSAKLRAAEKV